MASKEALALLEAAFPGSGPGPGLLCAQSRSRRCFLAVIQYFTFYLYLQTTGSAGVVLLLQARVVSTLLTNSTSAFY